MKKFKAKYERKKRKKSAVTKKKKDNTYIGII